MCVTVETHLYLIPGFAVVLIGYETLQNSFVKIEEAIAVSAEAISLTVGRLIILDQTKTNIRNVHIQLTES